jgi:hypothetical protein
MNNASVNTPDTSTSLSAILVALMKGVTYRDTDPVLWQSLLALSARAREYVVVLGLDLVLDEAEGYAYLRQRPVAEGEPELPHLVVRRQLGYHVSLLIALLRKKLAEFDARSGDTRLVLARDEIVDLVRVFLPDTANEARLLDRLETHINRIVELGFLRRLRGRDDQFEVQRILKAFVDAQWLNGLEERLAEYREHSAVDQNTRVDETS